MGQEAHCHGDRDNSVIILGRPEGGSINRISDAQSIIGAKLSV
jgi:hypothetical protein